MIVRENIFFTRGMDSKVSLGIGMEDILEVPIKDYSLMPAGYYKARAQDTWGVNSFFYCNFMKTKDGGTIMTTSWITVDKKGNEKPDSSGGGAPIGDNQSGFNSWVKVNKIYHIEFLGKL